MPFGTADFDRSDQINQNSRAYTVPPRGTGQTDSKASLNDVERSGSAPSKRMKAAKLALSVRRCSSQCWWSQTGSNRRPHACKARALPTELWPLAITRMVGPGRLELPTSRLSGVRSNHLSYGPSGSRQKTSNKAGERDEPRKVRCADA